MEKTEKREQIAKQFPKIALLRRMEASMGPGPDGPGKHVGDKSGAQRKAAASMGPGPDGPGKPLAAQVLPPRPHVASMGPGPDGPGKQAS